MSPPEDLPDLGDWDETLLDETLLDGADEPSGERTLPQDAALRRAVLEQRLVHGLLRQRYDSAAAREARVRGILAALPVSSAGAAPVHSIWRRFGPALAAAAVLLVTAAALMWPGSDAERIEKLWAQAKQHLADEVDRRFTLRVSRRKPGGSFESTGHHVFTVRPGGRFRIEVQGEVAGDKTVGCDGVHVWLIDRTGGGEARRTHDVRDRVREFFKKELLGAEGFFDVGYFSLESVLDEIHESVLLFEHDIEPMVAGGPSFAHVWGEGDFELGLTDVELIDIWCDKDTHMIRRVLLDLHDDDSGDTFRFEFEYEGVVKTEPGFYSRPQ